MIKIFTWNCRGAGSKRFLRVFREYRRKYRPSIVIIVEPKINGDKAEEVIKEMRFDKQLVVDAAGQSGGIWVLWDSGMVTITEVHRAEQFLHVRVHCGQESWLLTAVYANPALIQRRELWTAIRRIAEEVTEPWLLAGDFNSILQPVDKLGGTPFDAARARDFQDCVLDAGLLDMGFSGPPFTWFRTCLKERLDRGLANPAWNSAFPDTIISHLPRLRSDHRPILINLNPLFQPAGHKPFKFLAAWLLHEGFKDMVTSAWGRGTDLASSIAEFTEEAKQWNKNVFGNIMKKKNDLLGRIKRLELRYGGDSNDTRLVQARAELESVLLQEEMLWYQKSRLEWIAYGDSNTKHFHSRTISRRQRNRVAALKNFAGEWVDDQNLLLDMARQFYEELYTDDNNPLSTLQPASGALGTTWRIVLD
ncbi:unnamed protein product [Linum trigynum]|uniref:Endonuclease/exonuclease/phosphatase domain-containing protein n=1 Tax=Linum trigynum TaxID=586398 RepID=A0AAV2E7T8_9ROSI